MTQLWNRFCEYHLSLEKLGIELDISRMKFDENFLPSIEKKFVTAFESMAALERGEIANPDERRMVGHYWLRTPSLSPTSEIRAAIETAPGEIEAFAGEVHSGALRSESGARFTQALLLGIGGSALGPQLVRDALWNPAQRMELLFCDNTDPDGINRTVLELGEKLDETLVIVVSKSGGTVETANAVAEISRAFSARKRSFEKHAVAVTCKGSKLDLQAANWLKRFEMWDWVGGRTSLFSAVGLLPAALQGFDIKGFVEGARVMDEHTRKSSLRDNPAALLAAVWYAVGRGRGEKDMVILPYKDRLVLLSKYLQQLVMESLGKELNLQGEKVNQGIAVYGNKGSTDQHAYIQQLRDGLNNFFATFIEILEDYHPGVPHPEPCEVKSGVTTGDYLMGFLQGTRRALYENDRESITLTAQRLDAKTLGAFIALFERSVGLYASLIGVNAYHQPGVEAGKKAAEKVVALQQQLLEAKGKLTSSFTAEEAATTLGNPEETETVFKILEHLASNSGRGIVREGWVKNPAERRYRFN